MMNPYVIIAGILVVLGLCFGSLKTGEKLERATWQAAEIKAAAAAKADHDKLVQANEDQRTAFDTQTKKASEDHAKETAAVTAKFHADAGKRVRVSFCDAATVPTNNPSQGSGTGSPSQATPPAQFLPDTFAGALRQLAADADSQVADLRQLVTASKDAKCFAGY